MKKVILFIITLPILFSLSYAQKPGIKPIVRSSTVERAVATQQLLQPGSYHPVFGYIPTPVIDGVAPWQISIVDRPGTYQYGSEIEMIGAMHDIQIIPLFTLPKQDWLRHDAFEPINSLNTKQVTQAIYLWRLANPNSSLNDFPHTKALLQRGLLTYSMSLRNIEDFVGYPPERQMAIDAKRNLPSIKLLHYLLTLNFIPQSYADLAATTSVYPKHITINAETMPIPSAEVQQAEVLDTMLMLSNPREMTPYNNTWGQYEPFTLTPEEHAAANQLLALRQQAYRLPDNPTPRQALEELYNRLSSLIEDYKKPNMVRLDKFYSQYTSSDIYPTIQQMVRDQHAMIAEKDGKLTLINPEITHLIVLDAIMSKGSLFHNPDHAWTALQSFEALCAYTNHNADNIPHLKVLLYGLYTKLGDRMHTYTEYYGNTPAMEHIEEFLDNISYGSPDEIIRSYHF